MARVGLPKSRYYVDRNDKLRRGGHVGAARGLAKMAYMF